MPNRLPWIIAACAAFVLIVGAASNLKSAPMAPAAPKSSVKLELSVQKTTLTVGDELKIKLHARNTGAKAVHLVRPLDGSWDDMRQPKYSLEYLDNQGQPIASPLGFPDPGRCGLTNALKPAADILKVGAGAQILLSNQGSFMPYTKVLPEALPGKHKVRVRYKIKGIAGADDMELVSNAVTLTIRGGDAKLWQCRSDQLAALQTNHYADLSPGHIAPVNPNDLSEGYVSLGSLYEHREQNQKTMASGKLLAQRLDAKGKALGAAVVVADNPSNSVGHITAVHVPGGLVIAHSPGAVGGREVRTVFLEINGTALTPRSAKLISAAPGNPYVLAMARHNNTLGLIYEGPESKGGPWLYRALDLRGNPISSPKPLFNKAFGSPLLVPTPSGFMASWQTAHNERMFQPLRADGAATQPSITITGDAAGTQAFDIQGQSLHLAYVDSGVDHQVAGDTMGFYRQSMTLGGHRGAVIAISPTDRNTPHRGDAAWMDDGTMGSIFYHRSKGLFFVPTKGKARRLS